MSTRDIIVHTSTNVFAGSGTTSIALRAMIYYLCRNPKTMAKLIQEIDEADCLGVLSYPISYKQSKDHIPYVEAVMKESMRIHPGIGLLLERYVPDGGAEICGQHIPAGTVVGVNAWVTHHDPIRFSPTPISSFQSAGQILVRRRRLRWNDLFSPSEPGLVHALGVTSLS